MSDCWLWGDPQDHHGYGRVYVAPRIVVAHRFVYEALVGPIPEGMELDHVRARGCLHRNCVNPEHLEVVTRSQNVQRADLWQRAVTHCPQGHEYSGVNLYINPKGDRVCRACRRAKAWEALHPGESYPGRQLQRRRGLVSRTKKEAVATTTAS